MKKVEIAIAIIIIAIVSFVIGLRIARNDTLVPPISNTTVENVSRTDWKGIAVGDTVYNTYDSTLEIVKDWKYYDGECILQTIEIDSLGFDEANEHWYLPKWLAYRQGLVVDTITNDFSGE